MHRLYNSILFRSKLNFKYPYIQSLSFSAIYVITGINFQRESWENATTLSSKQLKIAASKQLLAFSPFW
jgi:hypothetical protein